MKIALVCPYDWSRHGGVQSHVRALAERLAADHDVRVFTPASAPVAERDVVVSGRPVGLRYNRSVAPVALSPLAARRLLRGLRDFAPHVTHIHEPLAPALSLAAAAFGPTPAVGTFHAWSSSDRAYRAAAPLLGRAAARLAVRIAVSPAAQRYAAEALGLPLGAFRLVPNGVDTQAFARAEPIAELVDPERPLLLFVGRLEPRKGLDVLLRAFLRLRASRPRLRLCVVGEGPDRRRCQEMVPSSIRPDVLFVGAVSEQEKPRYHASADLYIAPNTGGESFGMVLLEGMAAGLPVIASDIPGFRTVLQDGREGRLVTPNDAFALAEAIDTLLSNDRLRQAMAGEGRSTAAGYDWSVVTAKVLDLYREAMNRPAP